MLIERGGEVGVGGGRVQEGELEMMRDLLAESSRDFRVIFDFVELTEEDGDLLCCC